MLEGLVDALDHRLEDRRSPFLGRGRALGPPQDAVVAADDAGQNLRPAQVDPDHRRSIALPGHTTLRASEPRPQA